MISIKKPVYLLFPAYCIGAPLVCFCATALPVVIGLPVAALLCLILLGGPSLLHSKIPLYDEACLALHALLYVSCLGLALGFARFLIPGSLFAGSVSAAATNTLWLRVFFVAAQQACYFGVHAFNRRI
jgi:hypothetical protein